MTATTQGARALAWWIANNHPAVFAQLAQKARVAATRTKLSGLGCACRPGLGDDDSSTDYFGTPLDTYTDSSTFPDSSSTFNFDVVDPDTFTTPTIEVAAPNFDIQDPSSSTTPSSSILSSVANYLTSPAGLTAAATIAVGGLQVYATSQQAAAQQAVLQAQASRVAAGLNPAAISYTVNPATGQVMPVVSSTTGQYLPVTSPLLAQLAGGGTLSTFLSQYGLWLLIAGAAVLVLRR